MTGPAILSQITGDSARARATDPETSHAAADSISHAALEASEVEVLEILAAADGPVTAEQIERRNTQRAWQNGVRAWSGSRIRTALHQLVEKRAVVQDGEGKTASGRRAAAWRLTTEGETR